MNLSDLDIESREAIKAGKRAKRSLENALSYINDAKNWGIVDILGGGFITSLAKRSKMKDAQKYIEEAKFELEIFSDELRDVKDGYELNIDTDDFLGFADIVFDNIFVDFMVQKKIDKAKCEIENLIFEIDEIIEELQGF